MQICRTCKVAKPPWEFYPNHRRAPGFETRCKACTIKDVKKTKKKMGGS